MRVCVFCSIFAQNKTHDMEEIRFDTIQQVNDHYGVTTLHPMVTVIHLEGSGYAASAKTLVHYGVYAIWLKETKGCSLMDARHTTSTSRL